MNNARLGADLASIVFVALDNFIDCLEGAKIDAPDLTSSQYREVTELWPHKSQSVAALAVKQSLERSSGHLEETKLGQFSPPAPFEAYYCVHANRCAARADCTYH